MSQSRPEWAEGPPGDVVWEALRKLDEDRTRRLAEERLTSDEIRILLEDMKTHRAVPSMRRYDGAPAEFVDKMLAHGLICDPGETGKRIQALDNSDWVYPLTLRGLKAVLTRSADVDLRYDLAIVPHFKREQPLVLHNKALLDTLRMVKIECNQITFRAWGTQVLRQWCFDNGVCVIYEDKINMAKALLWVHVDDVPLFRLRWEGLKNSPVT